jgi:hypothetical protein
MRTSALRVRAVTEAYVYILIIVLALVFLVGAVATVDAYQRDQTTSEVRTVASWESAGTFTHHATVRNETQAFREGTVLRNRAAYFTRVSPVLNGSFQYSYTASETGNVSVDADLALVTRSTAETETGERREYWRVERPLGDRRVESLAPGQQVSIPFSTNVTDVSQRAAAIDSELGGSPGTTQVLLVARIAVNGTRNGEPVALTREYTLELVVEESVFRVREPTNGTHSGAQRERVTVPVEPNPIQSIGGPILAVVGLLASSVLFVAHRRGELGLTDAEREWLAYRTARDEFDEWITAGHPKSELDENTRIEVATLEGLVDVAIDSDRRIIEDTEREHFVVRDDTAVYEYVPPADPRPNDGHDTGILAPLSPGTAVSVETDESSAGGGHSDDDDQSGKGE